MSTNTHSELEDFVRFVLRLVESGEKELSPEDALMRWQMENLTPEEYDEEVAAIQEAFDDMRAGDRGIPMNEFFARMDKKYGFPPKKP